MTTNTTGSGLIVVERQRQVDEEGWTPEHDAGHGNQALAWAAVCYAAPDRIFRHAPSHSYEIELTGQGGSRANKPAHMILLADPWPWSPGYDKRQARPWKDKEAVSTDGLRAERIRELTKAGALIAAEIDRILAHA